MAINLQRWLRNIRLCLHDIEVLSNADYPREEIEDLWRGIRDQLKELNNLKEKGQLDYSPYKFTRDDNLYYFMYLQSGRCAICKQLLKNLRKAHIDHNHQTKQLRGLLCHWCNLGLGHFKDNISTLRNAIEYLEANNEQRHTS